MEVSTKETSRYPSGVAMEAWVIEAAKSMGPGALALLVLGYCMAQVGKYLVDKLVVPVFVERVNKLAEEVKDLQLKCETLGNKIEKFQTKTLQNQYDIRQDFSYVLHELGLRQKERVVPKPGEKDE